MRGSSVKVGVDGKGDEWMRSQDGMTRAGQDEKLSEGVNDDEGRMTRADAKNWDETGTGNGDCRCRAMQLVWVPAAGWGPNIYKPTPPPARSLPAPPCPANSHI